MNLTPLCAAGRARAGRAKRGQSEFPLQTEIHSGPFLEAKWQEKASANEAVYQFAGKIEGKMYGRGLFFSIHGFSENVVSSLVAGKAIKTVFIDGGDLILVLEGLIDFTGMLDRKIKAAQTKGLIYIDAITGKSKL